VDHRATPGSPCVYHFGGAEATGADPMTKFKIGDVIAPGRAKAVPEVTACSLPQS
jgi:hypothetical protein